MPRALKRFLRTGRLGGVSTIEQQLVRTVLERRERSVKRKLREFFLAFLLVFHASKRHILIAYLDICYLGYKIRGVDGASLQLFGNFSRHLTQKEASFIASLLVYPIPKSIISTSKLHNLLPISDIERYLSYPEIAKTSWAEKVRRRTLYGVALLSRAY